MRPHLFINVIMRCLPEQIHVHFCKIPHNLVTDPEGGYVCELLSALYAKPDGSGYVKITLSNTIPKDNYATPTYVIDGSYETAYYYTNSDGYEFLVKMHNGNIWADCTTNCASASLFGAYLTQNEIEDILDNLQLSIQE